jgi:hypothetical protein
MDFQLGEELERTGAVTPADPQVLLDGQLHEDGPLLGHQRESVAGPDVERVAATAPEHPDVAAERGQLACDRQERRRLACPVGSEQRHHLPWLHP